MSGGHSHGEHSHSHGGHAHANAEHGLGFVEDPAAPRTGELPAGAGAGKVLFLDTPSGISGDMMLGALADLGVPVRVLGAPIAALGLGAEAELVLERGHAGAIGASRARVLLSGHPPSRDHATIVRLIERSSLDARVKELSLAIFRRLAEAEAEVHRVAVDQVTFHEVGATDSIVDIVGSAAGFVYLGARVIVSPLPIGSGMVQTRHGPLPLPAPATLLCLRGVPTRPSNLERELVTPTGAAIAATVASEWSVWPSIATERVGWGAGTMVLSDRPNALRAILATPVALASSAAVSPEPSGGEKVVLLEANIDDMTGELAAHAVQALLRAGAKDAWLVPIIMKGGRPAFVLSALGEPASYQTLEEVYFRETTTLGVRRRLLDRTALPREVAVVETKYGAIPVKHAAREDSVPKPEFRACQEAAERHGVSVRSVIEEARRVFLAALSGPASSPTPGSRTRLG